MTVAALDWAREQEPLGNDESPQPETSAGEASDERTAQLQESDDPLKGTWDFIIGADLVYARSAVEPLAKASEWNERTCSGLLAAPVETTIGEMLLRVLVETNK